MANATPAKLKNGAWGARVQGSVAEGDTVTITTRSGKSWEARVTSVVWSGSGVSICATESLDRAPAASAKTRSRNWDPNAFAGYGRARGAYRKACRTDGNCSSIGSGRSCGGHDCDGF